MTALDTETTVTAEKLGIFTAERAEASENHRKGSVLFTA
jgi:hypothetical protein